MDNETIQIIADKIGVAVEKLEPIVGIVIEEVVRAGWYRVYFAIAVCVFTFSVFPMIICIVHKVTQSGHDARVVTSAVCGFIGVICMAVSITELYQGFMQIAAPSMHLLEVLVGE